MGWEDFLLHKKEVQNKLQGHFSTTGLSVLPCSPPSSRSPEHSPTPNSTRASRY